MVDSYWLLVIEVSVSGSNGTVKSVTDLAKVYANSFGFWIQGKTVVTALGKRERLGFWKYPKGGKAWENLAGITKGAKDNITDVNIVTAQ